MAVRRRVGDLVHGGGRTVGLVLGYPGTASGAVHSMQMWRTEIAARTIRDLPDAMLVFSGYAKRGRRAEADIMADLATMREIQLRLIRANRTVRSDLRIPWGEPDRSLGGGIRASLTTPYTGALANVAAIQSPSGTWPSIVGPGSASMSDQRAGSAPERGGLILGTLILGSSLAFIDGTVVNVALPFVQTDLKASATGVQWVVQAYALFLAALILVGGSLGDKLGRRKIYVAGVVVFTIASIGAGVAPNLEILIAARVLQGIGGALLVPGGLSIISALWSGTARGMAIGTWAAFTSITSAIGPPVGGFLVDQFSWRAVFLINVPIAALVLVGCAVAVPENRDADATDRIDWPGAALATLSLGGFVYGFTRAADRGWTDAVTIFLLAAGLVIGAGFLLVEGRTREPMVELSLFRSPTFSGANLLTFLLYGALAAALYYLPFNLVQVQGYGATEAGSALLPFALIMFAGSRWAGGLIGRFGSRPPLMIGPAIVGVAFLFFALSNADGSYWVGVFPMVVVLGIGMTITVAPLTTTVMDAVDSRHSGLASGVNNAVSRAGSAVAIAVFSIMIVGTFTDSLDSKLDGLSLPDDARARVSKTEGQLAAMPTPDGLNPEQERAFQEAVDGAFGDGFRGVMIGSALIAFISAGITAVTVKKKTSVGGESPAAGAEYRRS